jgi:hypothetical protein
MIEGALLFAELALFGALLLAVKRMARNDRKSSMGLFSYHESETDTSKTKGGKAGGRRA